MAQLQAIAAEKARAHDAELAVRLHLDRTVLITGDGRELMLTFNNLSLTLGSGVNRTDALVDVNLEIARGELIAVTGRSGSGKSSLLNVAGGLVSPSSGSVIIDGVDLATRPSPAASADFQPV